MEYHNFTQGSAEWHAHRRQFLNASDAPAMMGCSPYQTRTELLARMKTGISQDVDAATQRRFDDGHRFEALARPLAEKIIGEDLYPVTGSSGKLSASFDGLTMDESTALEHKSINDSLRYTPWDEGNGDHLPLHYRVQMEHQMIVSGAERVLFMASKWNGEELVEERHCWYTADADLRAQIIAGWEQFERDLAEFEPAAPVAPVVANQPESLPAVSVRVDGQLAIVSNLPAFGDALRAFIERIPAEPSTDQEFADTEAACKALKRAEEALESAEENALAQLADVDTMRRLVADYRALARVTRLQREKLVAQRKDQLRMQIAQEAGKALLDHVAGLNASLGERCMPTVPADFGGAIKGKKNLDSMRDAVATELARAKIAANEIAERIRSNMAQLVAAGDTASFPDAAALVLKAPDDLAAIIAQRVAEAERRLEAAREQARQDAAAAALRATTQQAQAAADAAREAEKQIIKIDGPFTSDVPMPPPDTGARLTLGQINERLAPVSITVAGLAQLGFEPVEQVKASRLYRESDLPAICKAISAHVLRACAPAAA